ncbi:methylisocitrate lyase [Acuticoccus sp.]|uniref:methylisocitrate lyase n=1 Tax=Acuticoccus sp. TaxID=1904378 RepID=UPI003B52D55C
MWLNGDGREGEPAGTRLASLIAREGILEVPGAHHALAGLLAKRAGFEALYLSGGAVTGSMGLPDLGVMTLGELVFFTRSIVRATGLPLIVDADTGYGEALNVMRAVRELEDAGAAAIQLEDQVLPKKCGHLSDKRLAPVKEMEAKVAAACRARRHALVVARTDAASVSLDEAIHRAQRYVAAGADVIFGEALVSEDDFRAFTAAVDAPVLVNMTEFGRTPAFTSAQFAAFGAKVVIWPVSSLRVAAAAIEDLYAAIRADGGTHTRVGRMQPRAALYETIGYHDYEALDASIARSVLPGEPGR